MSPVAPPVLSPSLVQHLLTFDNSSGAAPIYAYKTLYGRPIGSRVVHLNQFKIRRIASSRVLRRVALVRTDVSAERIASIIRATRIGELGTTLAVTSNRRTLIFLRSLRYG
jgi:hypothetical protein